MTLVINLNNQCSIYGTPRNLSLPFTKTSKLILRKIDQLRNLKSKYDFSRWTPLTLQSKLGFRIHQNFWIYRQVKWPIVRLYSIKVKSLSVKFLVVGHFRLKSFLGHFDKNRDFRLETFQVIFDQNIPKTSFILDGERLEIRKSYSNRESGSKSFDFQPSKFQPRWVHFDRYHFSNHDFRLETF